MTKPKQRPSLRLDVHVTLSDAQMTSILIALDRLGDTLEIIALDEVKK